MHSKMEWGIRKKAAAYIIVLLILVSGLTLGFSYVAHTSVENDVEEGTAEILMQQAINDSIALNRNASLCLQNYMDGICVSVESAALDTHYHMGIEYAGSEFRWTSKYLLTQVNVSLIREIMDGNISNEYYNEMIRIAGDKETVDGALHYFIHPPAPNYSDPHVNASAYNAINSLGASLFDQGSTSLHDFLYSVICCRNTDISWSVFFPLRICSIPSETYPMFSGAIIRTKNRVSPY